MNSTNQLLSEKYIEGTLSDQEQAEFELKMLSDADFAREVGETEDIVVATQVFGRSELKKELQRVANAEPLPSDLLSVTRQDTQATEGQLPRMRRIYQRLAGVAAAIVLIFAAGWWFTQKRTSPESLFVSYFEPYPNVAAPIVRNATAKKPLEQALLLYEQKNYAAAITQLSALSQQTEAVRFYLAMSHLSNGNAKAAIKHFAALKGNVSASYQKQTLWYLAMAHLANQDVNACKNVLKQLTSEDNFYQKKALELMKQL
jgi:anti-sigma-K factor RskA